MGILFISHSKHDNERALEVRDWLYENGWTEIFLDIDLEQGLVPGQRWQDELKKVGERCSAVILLISPKWTESAWCQGEAIAAKLLGKRIFGVLIEVTLLSELPIGLPAIFQLVDISDPATEASNLERLRIGLQRAGLDPTSFPWPPPEETHRSPYRGLRPLEEQDAAVFFGRDAPITRGLDTLRRLRAGSPERMLVILGASGAGKSSFLKAGLLARLRRDEENFLVLPTVRPESAALTGSRGLLGSLGLVEKPSRAALAAHLKELRRPILERFRTYAEAAGDRYEPATPPTCILPIDQAEELFSTTNLERIETLELLIDLFAVDVNLIALLTLRSDSFSLLQSEPMLSEIPRIPFDLSRLSQGAFKEVIEGPGRLADPEIRFEPELTERLMRDLDSPDALPLLAFTLEQLVAEHRGDGKLEMTELEEELRGVEGAIKRAVEEAFRAALCDSSLPDSRRELDDLARRAFVPWLVTIDDAEAPPKRRLALVHEIPEEARRLVEQLVNQRLLVSNQQDGETTIEVSHEAVLRNWQDLVRWIEQERGELRMADAVRAAAEEWERNEQADAWLDHRSERLVAAEALLEWVEYRRLLGDAGRIYLGACRRRENEAHAVEEQRIQLEREQLARQRQLQRHAGWALFLVAVLVFGFAGYALSQRRTTSQQESRVLADYARQAIEARQYERACRLAALASREGFLNVADPAAVPNLAIAAQSSLLVFESREVELDGSMFSPDGGRVLISETEQVVRIWDVNTGDQIATIQYEGGVWDVAFDSSGRRVVSSGWDGTVHVWDAFTGRQLASVQHEGQVEGTLFDVSGENVLSWSSDGVARVWKASNGMEMAWTQHRQVVAGATFDGSGGRVLSWSRDGTARVWDAATSTILASAQHESSVGGAAFDDSEQRVFSWSYDGAARIWDANGGDEIAGVQRREFKSALFNKTGESALFWSRGGKASLWDALTMVERPINKERDWIYEVTFDERGERILYWSMGGATRVLNASTGTEISLAWQEGAVSGATFDGSGTRVLSWSWDGTARVWDAADGTEIATMRHTEQVSGAVFDSSDRRVLSWGRDGTARIWDAATEEMFAIARHDARVRDAMFDQLGKRALSWSGDGTVRVWDATKGDSTRVTQHGGPVKGALFGKAGKHVISWSVHGLRLWNVVTGAETILSESSVRGAIFDRRSERLLSWDSGGETIWDVAKGSVLVAVERPDWVDGAMFDESGERVLSWNSAGEVRVWDAYTGIEISSAKDQGPVRGAAFDRSGQRVLYWTDEAVRLWDAQKGAEIEAIPSRDLSWTEDGNARFWHLPPRKRNAIIDFDQRFLGLRFDGSGERVLSWRYDVASIWDVATMTEMVSTEHDAMVSGARFNASDKLVLSWSRDGRVKVWNAATGAEIAIAKHDDEVNGAAFDSGGQRVLSWSDDRTVRVWHVEGSSEIVFQHPAPVLGATFDSSGERVLAWDESGLVQVWDASWTAPRASNRDLITEVCTKKLRGPESVSGSSVRKISVADAAFAPILKDRIGEDVCDLSWW